MSQGYSNNKNSFNIGNTFINITPDDESKILAWLSPLEPGARHRDIGAQRLDSIGSWLLETQEFRRWYSDNGEGGSNHRTLFCHGNPGAGKSYIISQVIDKLCDEAVEDNTAVACFYFDFASRNEQSPVNMLGSLLRQIVSGLEGIPKTVVESFRNQKKVIGGRGLQVAGILKMFQTITATKRTFVCIDALDECAPEHRIAILESLGQIVLESLDTRIFVTGRSHVRSEVERKLGGAAAFVLIEPTGDGIIGYLRERLRCDTTPEMMSSALEHNIMESISQTASGTFLLASLHIEAILRETSLAQREKRLKAVKDGVGLGEAYGATLERIKTQGGGRTKLAIAALMWICHAERPLQADELRHALAVEIGSPVFNSENAPSIGALLGYSQGLITVDKESSTVRLIHFTVQEYLCAHPGLFSHPHSVIAKTCLTYLNSRQVKSLPSEVSPGHQVLPFLKYSSRYWGIHANREFSVHLGALALKLLSSYPDHPSAVSLLEQAVPAGSPLVASTPHRFSGLHCASFFGIHQLVAVLMDARGYEINQGDCGGNTPLSWAARNGHEGAVKLLLEREDIDPERTDSQVSTPLTWAARNGHGGIVKQLLERQDTDPNSADSQDNTPLVWAAHNGHEVVVKLLLDREDVEPNRPDNEGGTPLFWAANNGHEGVVKLLLDREDVEPNRPDNEGGTPLFSAANNGHEGVVKLLLDQKDVDPNHSNKDDRTPLRAAAVEGHEGVVKLLLGREDIDPNRSGSDGRTPVACAAHRGHEGVVKLLLDRNDVDPNRPGEDASTPLALAACEGHKGTAKLLLARDDVDPNCLGKGGKTPLVWAASDGHDGVVELLLGQEDVEPNRPDNEGGTPLFWAANNGHDGVVKLLLDQKDVDLNHANKNNRTPLRAAAVKGHEGVAKLLLGREDVDPNQAGLDGGTPLSCAAENGYEGVVKLLLDRNDVDPNRPDAGGLTPLGCAVYWGHKGAAKLLLARDDVDPNYPDKYDQTPLGWAASIGYEGMVDLLLGREDVNPSRPDGDGRTPLAYAAMNGHEEVVNLLQARISTESAVAQPPNQH